MPKAFNWYKIKYLESTDNIKSSLLKSSGRQIQTKLANDIMACVQQGRCFFEQAQEAPLEIRPLIIYYGMVGFAKATVMSRTMNGIETLPKSHGLSDITDDNSLVESLRLKFNNRGTFQSFNDALSGVEKILLHDGGPDIKRISAPTCNSNSLTGIEMDLKSILGRMPGIGTHFKEVFNENPASLKCSHISRDKRGYGFQVYPNETFSDEAELKAILDRLKREYGFLNGWSFEYANWSGGFTTVKYSSLDPTGFDSLPDDNLEINTYGFKRNMHMPYKVINHDYENELIGRLPSISGNLNGGNTCIIKPYGELMFSEMSLFYLGMFLLSSLVRYRPNVWTNSISRRSVPGAKVDDKMLSLVELFLEESLSEFPRMTVQCILEPHK